MRLLYATTFTDRGNDVKPSKYQLAIALESTTVLNKIMGIQRKRPVVMKRWRKLSKYMKRSLQGKDAGV